MLWDGYSLDAEEAPQGLSWLGDRFLAVGKIGNSLLILSSTNGVGWSHRRFTTRADDGRLTDIARQNGVFVLQGFVSYGRFTTGTVVLTSRDAENWTAWYDPLLPDRASQSGRR